MVPRITKLGSLTGLIVFLTVMVSVSGCYYDKEDELYQYFQDGCDTVNLSYSADVLPVIQTHCYQCHDGNTSFGQVNLEGYNGLKIFADNGRLYGAINHLSGFSPMPKNAPKLSDCNIKVINKWINNGAPNN